jgi:hypothetical protein
MAADNASRHAVERRLAMARATAIEEMVQTFGCGTRRGVLRLVAGTTAGAVLLGGLGIDAAAAKCVAPGKKCKSKKGKK